MILDVGCGKKKYPGSIGIDFDKESDADIIHDLESIPYPFKDNVFDFIWCHHALEHLSNTIKVMEELHRIAKPNAIIEIHVPHCLSTFAHMLSHKRTFVWGSFDIFEKEYWKRGEKYTSKEFQIIERMFCHVLHDAPYSSLKSKILLKPIVKIIDFFSNKNPHFYERLWGHWVGGPDEIIYKLKVIK